MARWARVNAFEGNRVAPGPARADARPRAAGGGGARASACEGPRAPPGRAGPRPCPLCGGAGHRPVLEFAGFQYHLDSAAVPKRVDIRTVQCLDCLALFQDPVLTAAGYAAVMTEAAASFRASEHRPDEQVAWILDRGLAGGGRRLL